MPDIVDRATWLAARRELLEAEKEYTRAGDRLAARRRALPWVEVTTDYRFEAADGEVGLADLFGERSQLLIYHFMFPPDWGLPCRICSFWADHFDAMRPHLANRDVEMVAVSQSPFARLEAWKPKAGWSFPWVSSHGSSFNADFHVSLAGGDDQLLNLQPAPEARGEIPALSTFVRERDRVFHAYSTYMRGVEPLNGTYRALDLMPRGRDEAGLDWSMQWVERLADRA